VNRPLDAVVAVTYRCNCQCIMCNIWRAQEPAEVRPGAYGRLPRSLRFINVSGGEPFLRSDLPEVIRHIASACPKASLVISTNGLLANAIREMMPRILEINPRIGVAVSLDGVREVHDRVRGVRGAYGKARHAVNLLRRLGVRRVRIAFTATPVNVGHMQKVYDISRDLGVEFTCAVAHCSPHYFRTAEGDFALSPGELRPEVQGIVKQELRTWSPRRWARAYFTAGLLRFAEGRGRPLPCTAGVDTLFVAPDGDVYPCTVFGAKMGNLTEQSFEDLWRSEEAQAVRRRLAGCAHGCWMVCSARMPMRRHLLRVFGWALWHKALRGRL